MSDVMAKTFKETSLNQPSHEQFMTDHFSISSSTTGHAYQMSVALPPSYYDNKNTKFPVMYLTDGHLNFHTMLGLSRWLFRNGGAGKIDEFIIVAIDYSYDKGATYEQRNKKWFKQRFSDFTPTPSFYERLKFKIKGQAEEFYQFIEKDVFKRMETNYRVDKKNRTLAGYSLGGLFTTYVLAKHPSTFQNFLIGDPALYYESTSMKETDESKCMGGVIESDECYFPDGPVFKYLEDLKESNVTLNAKVYLSSNENSGNVMMFNARQLEKTLRDYSESGTSAQLQIKAEYFQEENHITGVSRALQNGVLFIYRKMEKISDK